MSVKRVVVGAIAAIGGYLFIIAIANLAKFETAWLPYAAELAGAFVAGGALARHETRARVARGGPALGRHRRGGGVREPAHLQLGRRSLGSPVARRGCTPRRVWHCLRARGSGRLWPWWDGVADRAVDDRQRRFPVLRDAARHGAIRACDHQ